MAERITSITMQAFRGVPGTFLLDLSNGRSSAILGDNATGKSTIADAVEWYFKGRIDFLTKEGRGDAIRHSGAASGLETKVTVSTDGRFGGDITASVPPPQAVREVGLSEIFLLRGGTLADFINKTKGEKWQALAELLGLEAIDHMRLDLQRVRNELEDAERTVRTEVAQKDSALSHRIGEVSDSGIFAAFKEKCSAAQVKPPNGLDQALDPEWYRAMAPEGSPDQRAAALQIAIADLEAIVEQPVSPDPIDDWNRFAAEAETATHLRLDLYNAAGSLIEADPVDPGRCPLCEQPVDLDDLSRHISAELASLESATNALGAAQQVARGFVIQLDDAHRARSDIHRLARQHGVELVELPSSPVDALKRRIDEVRAGDQDAVRSHVDDLEFWDSQSLNSLQAAIPTPATERDQALVEIGMLQAEASSWKSAVRRRDKARADLDLANRVFIRYQQEQHDHFSRVVQEISRRVAEIYKFLHPEGGIGAVDVETVGDKGAELSIAYYGRKERPPHRVLSESHLNSLGIALFLTMAETFNQNLGFLVLDDIVNSFDREHRGRLADLLVYKFEDTQLIVLTHDEQFFTQISLRAPSWVKEHFTSWSYSGGPRTKRYQSDRLLEEAAKGRAEGDRIGAAQKGRRALEEFLQEACERLEALLPFRRGQQNDQRPAEEVIKGLRRTLKERAPVLNQELQDLLNKLEADLQAVLNVESHASLVSASNQEVSDALGRVTKLRGRFICQACGTRVWHTGTPEAARCKCGRAQFPPLTV